MFPKHVLIWNIILIYYNNPSEYTYGSSKEAYWKCQFGHIYIAKIKNIVNGQKCPVCLNRKKSIV
jgi:hypothetical protein